MKVEDNSPADFVVTGARAMAFGLALTGMPFIGVPVKQRGGADYLAVIVTGSMAVRLSEWLHEQESIEEVQIHGSQEKR